MSVARFVLKMMTGIRLANSRRMLRLIVLASVLAAKNFSYSYCCEFTRRMSAEPSMLSLMTLFSQSIASMAFLNSLRTFLMTIANVMAMTGRTAITPSASFQLIDNNKMLAPIIKKNEEMMDAIACETNVFNASTSEVRFVRSLAGVTCCMNA